MLLERLNQVPERVIDPLLAITQKFLPSQTSVTLFPTAAARASLLPFEVPSVRAAVPAVSCEPVKKCACAERLRRTKTSPGTVEATGRVTAKAPAPVIVKTPPCVRVDAAESAVTSYLGERVRPAEISNPVPEFDWLKPPESESVILAIVSS